VEAVVAGRFLGPAAPRLVGLQNILLRVGDDEIDDAGGATGQPGRGAGVEVVHGGGAHEGQLHVGVRVYAARHDVLAECVHHRGASRGG
jgi:hypothetical protein